MNKDTRALLALSLVPLLGLQRIRTLVSTFQEPHKIFEKSRNELLRLEGIGEQSADNILRFSDWNLVDEIITKTEILGVQLLGMHSLEYPTRLKQIFDPPVLLWVKGAVESLSTDGIAVVGTRNPSLYGKNMTKQFTEAAVQKGLSIFSGLAYGVDTIAHKTAVQHSGKTIAVLGSGIDWIYPAANKKLTEQIIEQGGAIITEFLPGTKPDARNFPVRNRIVSGLSMGVLVVETTERGGSRITANLALDQGREVFVVPHNLDNPFGTGCNELIKKGYGKLVQDFSDIEEELPINKESKVKIEPVSSVSRESSWKNVELSAELAKICQCIEDGFHQIDDLSAQTALSTQELLVRLLELEFQGLVNQKAGKQFFLLE